MKIHEKYLTEGINVTPKFIQNGIEFVKLLEVKGVKVTDWDTARPDVELSIKGKRTWYNIKDATNVLLKVL